jgi:hypothetical protein
MISAWTVTIIDGLLTGLGLYSLVLLRMFLGPIAGRRFGDSGRRAVWVLLILAMVVLAEFDLQWLRGWLDENDVPGARWYYEAVYASILVAVGLTLVRWRTRRCPAKQNVESTVSQSELD